MTVQNSLIIITALSVYRASSSTPKTLHVSVVVKQKYYFKQFALSLILISSNHPLKRLSRSLTIFYFDNPFTIVNAGFKQACHQLMSDSSNMPTMPMQLFKY